jgi:hypothetical protein
MKKFKAFSLMASLFTVALVAGCAVPGYHPHSAPVTTHVPGPSSSTTQTSIEKSLPPENKATAQKTPHKGPADLAESSYYGNVISDSKGSSYSNVTVVVARVGKNLVRINSDYSRLPVVEVPLTQAMGKILNAGGATTFLLDRSKAPAGLDISFLNEVSWSGTQQH